MLKGTPVGDLGWTAPAFTLNDFDGVTHSMSDHLTDQGLLIAFICNHCPYVKAIADRLAADTQTLLNEGFGVLAVMSNDFDAYPADAPEQMKAFSNAHSFSFPYLVDKDQAVARAYKAVCTPDFFGFNGDGHLQYRGRLDDAAMGDPTHRTPDLLNAMRKIAATGRGPKQQTASIGCSIKWL
ncbi:MAG: thioredoxin family protein [Tateyamaria sp.]|uniref:thioredoxin family protein n=1 Tax=Roseobacteraceae TaxID=2854170 RepID=UPI0032834A86